MILAVLQRRCHFALHDRDIYAATVGGVRLVEPAADLALALATAGGFSDRALPAELVVIGEVGLAGEVRRVAGVTPRLQEAARLGFTEALVPTGCGARVDGMRVREVADLQSALRSLGQPESHDRGADVVRLETVL